jgi:hypothetical protein
MAIEGAKESSMNVNGAQHQVMADRIQSIVERSVNRVQRVVQATAGNDNGGDPGVHQEKIQAVQERKVDMIQRTVDLMA